MFYSICRAILAFYCYCLNRYKVIGRENIPQDGSLIVCCNHQSMCDIFALVVAFKRPIRFMAKESLFKIPFINLFLKGFKAFPVDRKHADISAIKASLSVLSGGEVMGIFPEGTRVKPGERIEPKGGTGMLIAKAKTTALPVHIIYKRRFFIFNNIRVVIGKPITYEDFGITDMKSETYRRVSVEIMDSVYSLQ